MSNHFLVVIFIDITICKKQRKASSKIIIILSFFQLLKHDFQNRARFFKTLHTITHYTHTISRTPQTLCKIKHSCQNYQNHILPPYETHASNYFSVIRALFMKRPYDRSTVVQPPSASIHGSEHGRLVLHKFNNNTFGPAYVCTCV